MNSQIDDDKESETKGKPKVSDDEVFKIVVGFALGFIVMYLLVKGLK